MIRHIISALLFLILPLTAISQSKLNNYSRQYLDEINSSQVTRSKALKNGKIQAFIRIDDEMAISELESLGAEIHVDFGNNIYTALVPINNIDKISTITDVAEISFSKTLQT